MTFDPLAADCICNSSVFSLINCVAFHPAENIFCAVFSNRSMLVLYRVHASGRAQVLQKIQGPQSALQGPQHAAFSPDGSKIIVSDWLGESFLVFAQIAGGSYSPLPAAVIPFPEHMAGYKPHGMDISPSGRFLVAAFGNSAARPKAIAVFGLDRSSSTLQLLSLTGSTQLPGIPKGVCFLPGERSIAVTFSNLNRMDIYGFDEATASIGDCALQTVEGSHTGLDRPEDVRFLKGADQIIVSNSAGDALTFYPFDATRGRVADSRPQCTMGRPPSRLEFPHGLAVSPDGGYLVVSQFGPLATTADEDISFGRETPTRQAKIWIFKRSSERGRQGRARHWPWTPWVWHLRDRVQGRS